MRLILIIIILTLAVSFSSADPFLSCDPQEGVTVYKVEISAEETISPATLDGAAMHDLADMPIGETDGKLSAGKPWVLDGVPSETIEWGPSVPFVLGRPSASQSPMNIGLISEEQNF